jgi:hypothetical protein
MEKEKTQPTKVGKTFFIERGDGKIFAMDELEAWNTLNNRSSWQRNDFKLIGTSDGQTYVQTIKSAGLEKNKNDSLINEKSAELTRYLATLDKFKFELLLEDSDEKVVKVKGIIKGLQDEIAEINKEFSKGHQDIIDKAFKAELEKARGNIIYPENQNISTPRGDRDVIMRNMPR